MPLEAAAEGARTKAPAVVTPRDAPSGPLPAFEELYEGEFAFVWRSARALGAQGAQLDDVVQEVFLVVHKRLPGLELDGSIRGWLFGIVRLVVMRHARTRRRKPTHAGQAEATDLDTFQDETALDPEELAERAEAVQTLDRVLGELDDDKREVFVLAELEQMTLAEISVAIGVNPNTVASRLRAARRLFEEAVERLETSSRRPRWR